MQLNWLINPLSGGRQGACLERILHELRRQGVFDGEIIQLNGGDAVSALERLSKAERIIVAGGDGTVSQVLASVGGNALPVGVFPLGTANDLARELEERTGRRYAALPLWPKSLSHENVKRRLTAFLNSSGEELDLWRLEYGAGFSQARIFCNYASFGYEALIVREFNQWRRRPCWISRCTGALGNYLLYAGLALGNWQQGWIHGARLYNSESGEVITFKRLRSVFLASIGKVMGIGVSKRAGRINDGKIEMLALESLTSYLTMLSSYKWSISKPKLLGSAAAWEIEVLSPNTPVQVDGEPCPEISAPCRVSFAGTVKAAVV